MKQLAIVIILLFISTINIKAQSEDSLHVNRKESINLFVDCEWCDIEHFKTEINIVNYVRDRKNADVHLIITEMTTGSGGTEYYMQFIGKGRFENLTDTSKFSLPPNYTDEEERDAQIEHIKIGLTPFILKTPFADKIVITYNKDIVDNTETVEDKWRSWVFEINASGFANGEDVYTNVNTWSNVQASKVTPEIKIEISAKNSYNESSYRFDTDTITSYTKSNYGNLLITKSVGEHWAIGGFANVYGSTYSNIEVSASITPAVEYNVFKYSDATTKQMRFLYRVGYRNSTYIDTTIFNKVQEDIYYHHLSVNYKTVQQWGSIEGSIYGSTFLNDFSKNKIGIYLGSSIRLFKGLSFTLYGGYNQDRSQISLPKEQSSTEDILLRKKEMASNYSFWVNFGLSYTFGSIYNNVVNARFDD